MRLAAEQVVDGRYTLIERIGSGGMADVWKAHDGSLGRDVAIKVLHENFARDTQFVERFRREASAAAGLQHPNVVSVYDRGEWEGTYYIAMELVEGSSLRDLINRGLQPSESVEVARQVLAASSFAHARGIIHRDLKPLNVLIDRSGRIRVTDFGIARAGNSEITQTGSVMGTAQYLSPEQAQGIEVGPTADIYSVGVMLFEMLTGRVPFDGENAVAIAMKQVGEEPPVPSTINPKVTPALDAVVLKSLAKDPAQRFQTAEEMIAALDAAEASPGHTETFAAMVAEEEGRRKLSARTVALILALLLAAGALAYFLTRPDMVVVPGVTGQPQAEATVALQDAGFEVDAEEVRNPAAEGTVIEQDPRGGVEAEDGSTVTIEVSLGPGTVAVPKVEGLREAQARKALEDLGFEVQVERQASSSAKAGTVINSIPSEGTELGVGETVNLIVSSGVATEQVPDVVGMDRIEAETELENAGFQVTAQRRDSDEPEDTVLSQDPSALTDAEVGSRVTIVYSSGEGTITLGNYVGQDADSAENELRGLGLDVVLIEDTVDDESQDGIVLDQAPSVNTKLSPDDQVTLTVGVFEEPVEEEETTTTDETTDEQDQQP